MAVRIQATICVALACFSPLAALRADETPAIAYLAVASGYWEVWVANADGTGQRQVTRSKNDKTRVSWYPDGKALLAACNDGRVLKVDLDGNESLIPLEQYPVVDAVLSPDGKRLAFSFSTAIDGNDLWVSNNDGSAPEKVVKMTKLQHEPAWSPDGEEIYFSSGDGGQAHDIWRVSLKSRNLEQLTFSSLYNFDVAVSAAGDIAFSNNRSGNYEIYLQKPGKEATALTNDPALDAGPAFSPDGKEIVFESTRSGVPNLWRLDLNTNTVRQITKHPEGARSPVWYHGGAKR